MTNETVLTRYQELQLEYQNIEGFAGIRAFFRRARLARAMGEITDGDLAAFLAAGADEREWLDREIEQKKTEIAARKQRLFEHDAYRGEEKPALDAPAGLGFDKPVRALGFDK
jgi:hypothetical protein